MIMTTLMKISMHKKTRSYLLYVFLFIGCALRFAEYAAQPSLSFDEAVVAHKITRHSLTTLTFDASDFKNMLAYPIGFLALEKLALDWLGNNELGLRFFPFLFSVFSLFLFPHLAKKILAPPWDMGATLLFTISPVMVATSSVLKPLSADVFFGLLCFLILFEMTRRQMDFPSAAVITLIGLTAVATSFTAIFILFAGLPIVLILRFKRSPKKDVKFALYIAGIWLLAVLFYYVISLRYFRSDVALKDYWQAYFLPMEEGFLFSLKWLLGIFHFFFRKFLLIFPGLTAFLIILGTYRLLKQEWSKAAILGAPLIFLLILSALKIYPFGDRTVFIFVPVFLLLLTSGLVFFGRLKNTLLKICVPLIFMGLILSHYLPVAFQQLVTLSGGEEIKPVLQALSRRRQPGEPIAVFYGSRPAYQYYAPRFGLPKADFYLHPQGLKNFWQDLEQRLATTGEQRVWLVFTHVKQVIFADGRKMSERRYILEKLDLLGQRQRQVMVELDPRFNPWPPEDNVSAAAYLYKFLP